MSAEIKKGLLTIKSFKRVFRTKSIEVEYGRSTTAVYMEWTVDEMGWEGPQLTAQI